MKEQVRRKMVQSIFVIFFLYTIATGPQSSKVRVPSGSSRITKMFLKKQSSNYRNFASVGGAVQP